MSINVLSNMRKGNMSAFRKRWATWLPQGNNTAVNVLGITTPTVTGTATAHTTATTNAYTSMRKIEYLVTTPATTAVAGFIGTNNQWWRGNAAGLGGFNYLCQWGAATGVATSTTRAFVGMSNATNNPTDAEPSSKTDIIGMGWDAADTNIQIMHNDSTGTATKIDLGSNFPVPSADRTNPYEISLFCEPNSSTVDYQVVNLSSGAVATATISTDLPSSTTLLSPRGWMSVGGTSSEIGIALMQMLIESDR